MTPKPLKVEDIARLQAKDPSSNWRPKLAEFCDRIWMQHPGPQLMPEIKLFDDGYHVTGRPNEIALRLIAGPFPTLEVAAVAYKMLASAEGWL